MMGARPVTLQPWQVYALGAVIAAVGLWLGRRGPKVRARDVHNSVVADEVNGPVTITNAAPGESREAPRGDRIAWVIGIVGVLIAAAQLLHDLFGPAR
jgi:hypothetical protein